MRPLPYLLTSFCLALTHIAFSQQNYQDGYIIQHSSDTLRGQIDFRDWTINPKTISFQDGRGEKTEFSAPQIFAFFVSGETYRSYTVRIHPYSLDLDVLAAGLQSAPYDTTVFLRLLTAG